MAKVPVELVLGAIDKATAPLRQVEQALGGVNNAAEKINKTMGKVDFAGRMKAVAKNAGIAGAALTAGITWPVLNAAQSAIKVATDFESAMSRVRAAFDTTAENAATLEMAAMSIGKTTMFSASQAAQGLEELGKAGMKPLEALKALEPVLRIAGSETISMGDSAKYVVAALNQFQLPAEKAAHVSDVLAKAAGLSSTNVVAIAEAMSYAGGAARKAGVSIEETNAVIATLANLGVEGSRAGTAISTGISNVLANTKSQKALAKLGISGRDLFSGKDKLKSFLNIIEQLEKKKAGAADLRKIFGEEAGRVLAQLVGNSAALRANIDEINNSAGGFAQKMFEEKIGPAAKATMEFSSAMENLQISFARSGLLEAMTNITKALTRLIDWISELPQPVKQAIMVVGFLVATLGPLLLAVASVAAVLSFLTPVGWVVVGVIAAIAAAAALITLYWEPLKAFALATWTAISDSVTGAWDAIVAYVAPILAAFSGFVKAYFGIIATIIEEFTPLGIIIKNWGPISEWFSNLWAGILAVVSGVLTEMVGIGKYTTDIFLDGWKAIGEGIKEIFVGVFTWLTEKITGLSETLKGLSPVAMFQDWWKGPSAPITAPNAPAPAGGPSSLARDIGMNTHARTGQSSLKVSFDNVPRGTRVTETKNTGVPVDLNLGYAMGGP